MSKNGLNEKMSAPRRGRGRPPNPRKREAHRRKFFESAFNLSADASYGQTSVDQIVKGAGLSKGTFYWYFLSKEDCLRQAMERKVQEFEASVGKIFARKRLACTKLEALARFDDWIDEDVCRFFFILGTMEQAESPELQGFAHELRARWVGLAANSLRKLGRDAMRDQGWSRRRISEFDFDTWIQLWLASAEGLLLQVWTRPAGKIKAKRISDALCMVFIDPIRRGTVKVEKACE